MRPPTPEEVTSGLVYLYAGVPTGTTLLNGTRESATTAEREAALEAFGAAYVAFCGARARALSGWAEYPPHELRPNDRAEAALVRAHELLAQVRPEILRAMTDPRDWSHDVAPPRWFYPGSARDSATYGDIETWWKTAPRGPHPLDVLLYEEALRLTGRASGPG